jgi:hypothetical protein
MLPLRVLCKYKVFETNACVCRAGPIWLGAAVKCAEEQRSDHHVTASAPDHLVKLFCHSVHCQGQKTVCCTRSVELDTQHNAVPHTWLEVEEASPDGVAIPSCRRDISLFLHLNLSFLDCLLSYWFLSIMVGHPA